MAELNTGDGGGGKGGKVRSKKQNSKVDLTAMVDLAFLLITFFMLTTTLSKPQSMSLGLPDKDPKDKTPYVVVCLQECERMNTLLGEIKRSLEDLRLGLTGALNITDAMENLQRSLQFNKVPGTW